jgi:hypothetical protein
MDQKIGDHGSRNVVGQVRHDLELLAGRRGQPRAHGVEHRRVQRVLVRQRVEILHPDIRQSRDRLGRQPRHRRIDIDGHHRGTAGSHERRQGTRARTHLENHVIRAHFGRLDNQIMNIQIDQEILTQPPLGGNPTLQQQASEMGLGLSDRRHFSQRPQKNQRSRVSGRDATFLAEATEKPAVRS